MHGYIPKDEEIIFKAIRLYSTPAFMCLWGKSWREKGKHVSLDLYMGPHSFHFNLSKEHFKNLKTFLKKTLSHKSSSNEDLGFVQFDITNNQAMFFSYDYMLRAYVHTQKEDKQPSRLKEVNRMKADVAKHKVSKELTIIINDARIILRRKYFFILRDAVLNLKQN